MKKTRMILALLMAMLVVLGGMFMAAADEGQGSMEVSPGGDDEPPPVVTDPTEPPVVTDPTEPPMDPTEPPVVTDPTDEPTDEPTEEPTQDPVWEPQQPSGGDSTGQGTVTRPGVNTGGSIRQPNSASRQPLGGSASGSGSGGTGSSGSAWDPVEDGPQYVTFARVTQKSNSMSRTLFYSGAACVGTGLLGLLVLAVFIVRGRRADERGEIFAEIEQATVRQPVRSGQADSRYAREQDGGYDGYDGGGYGDQGYGRPYDPGYDQPEPSLYRPEPEELAVPVNGGLYTEEFELPPQQAGYREAGPMVPAEASMYTEEFQLPAGVQEPAAGRPAPGRPEMSRLEPPPEAVPRPAAQPPARSRPAPAPAPRPQPSSRVPAEQMDTTELLREILYGDERGK